MSVRDNQLSPSRHGIPGIRGKIHEYLNYLAAVSYYGKTAAVELDREFDILPNQFGEEFLCVKDYFGLYRWVLDR